MRNSVSEKQH